MGFSDPLACTFVVVRDGTRREIPVDLPETFNCLVGLRMESRWRVDGVLAVTGKDAEERECLILWRDVRSMDADALNGWFREHRVTAGHDALDVVYVNGDHTLNAIRELDESWTAETIEPVFRERMFETDLR